MTSGSCDLIILDPGYETRLTLAEKEQILAHDLDVKARCK